jgi:two-component system response regulator HydG
MESLTPKHRSADATPLAERKRHQYCERELTAMLEKTVLLVSDDSSLVELCSGVIASIVNLRPLGLNQSEGVESFLQRDDVALLLFHLVKRDAGGVGRLLRAIAFRQRPVATVVLAEQHDAEQALSLLRQGAADFLSRPLDLSRLAYLIDSLTIRARYAGVRGSVPGPVSKAGNESCFYLRSAAGPMLEQIHRVAPQDTTLLLGGETGTGKTRLARFIHELSPRREQPFLVIHCGALASNLMESEMFGHVRGAFTGADRHREGKFADAGCGTLLLDDIDSLPMHLQSKLLRAVEERVFEAVGSNKSVPVQARLIAASNRALEREVGRGRFRADLYYRLNVVTFRLPPLRDRPSVIPQLAEGFLREIAARNGRPVGGIAADALYALQIYGWPGNIRELRNVIERAVALCPREVIELSDLPDVVSNATPSPSYSEAAVASSLDHAKGKLEAAHIAEALRKHRNNRFRAAAELGISRMTLYRKLQKYRILEVGHV